MLQLAACGSHSRAPVEGRSPANRPPAPQQQVVSSTPGYTVQRGDTLYSIAFRYGLDFRRLAAANGINSPYTIYPGQRLLLLERAAPAPAAAAAAAAKPAPSPAQPPPPAAAVTKPSTPPVTKTVTPPAAPAASGPVREWRWPTEGKVIRQYSSTVHKGIDIGGNRGDAVVAVASGQVVYAGTGIVGLGELIIVKHNEQYLSAYGHNEQLLVAEGQMVGAGQVIAKKGSSGTDTVKLHFEIRRDGKPIDPLGVLPRR